MSIVISVVIYIERRGFKCVETYYPSIYELERNYG